MTKAPHSAETGATPRDASRILLIDESDRLLLFRSDGSFTFDGSNGATSLWFTPGGGREGDETPEETARRELWEETGLQDVELSPCVWLRHVVFNWNGVLLDSQESFFVCRVPAFELDNANWTEEERTDLNAHRWWTVDEIAASGELIVPSQLAALLRPILRGKLPDAPLEIGH